MKESWNEINANWKQNDEEANAKWKKYERNMDAKWKAIDRNRYKMTGNESGVKRICYDDNKMNAKWKDMKGI